MATSSAQPWRTSAAVRMFLVALLVGAAGIGGYSASHHAAEANSSAAASSSADTAASVASFTTADAGTCLSWDTQDDGTIAKFERIDCASPHRFEVSAREDLATYPASEFGADAPRPDMTRQAQLREELCQAATLRYLDGTLDPSGKYSIASILPPKDKWESGDRTMLCGVQSTNQQGDVVETSGHAAAQDQARVFAPGQCVQIDAASQTVAVDCGQPHQLEITSIVSLADVFTDDVPPIDQQDNHLRDVCTQASLDYLGGDEALYQSTLQSYWTTLPESSWAGGSRSVNCALVHARDDGSFSDLTGSATAGREGFTIDGQNPPQQPERNPLRSEQPGK